MAGPVLAGAALPDPSSEPQAPVPAARASTAAAARRRCFMGFLFSGGGSAFRKVVPDAAPAAGRRAPRPGPQEEGTVSVNAVEDARKALTLFSTSAGETTSFLLW
ncbi:hypothetical protein Pta02_03450 [Planobispora takensis]|uniref:Uncharacterized protein n=1 Tax=Planobispora takensis TaxID=1367882 RepID=A0A8J3SPS3_9ACTN|nr:hypothetical protein Pta02_03450 [Planobispora takensis]